MRRTLDLRRSKSSEAILAGPRDIARPVLQSRIPGSVEVMTREE